MRNHNNSPRIKPIKLQEAFYSLFERKDLKNKSESQIRDFHLERLLGAKKEEAQAQARLEEYLVESGNLGCWKAVFPDTVDKAKKVDPKLFEDKAYLRETYGFEV